MKIIKISIYKTRVGILSGNMPEVNWNFQNQTQTRLPPPPNGNAEAPKDRGKKIRDRVLSSSKCSWLSKEHLIG